MGIGGSLTSGVGNTVSGGVSLRANHRNTVGNIGIGKFGGGEYGIQRGEFDGKSKEYLWS